MAYDLQVDISQAQQEYRGQDQPEGSQCPVGKQPPLQQLVFQRLAGVPGCQLAQAQFRDAARRRILALKRSSSRKTGSHNKVPTIGGNQKPSVGNGSPRKLTIHNSIMRSLNQQRKHRQRLLPGREKSQPRPEPSDQVNQDDQAERVHAEQVSGQ